MSTTRPDRSRELTWSASHRLLQHNQNHAVGYRAGRPALEPTLRVPILACADHRADPAHVLALAPNEAVVLRNPGGRVTESFIQNPFIPGRLVVSGLVYDLDTGRARSVVEPAPLSSGATA
jgi:carbonic anhydrase